MPEKKQLRGVSEKELPRPPPRRQVWGELGRVEPQQFTIRNPAARAQGRPPGRKSQAMWRSLRAAERRLARLSP
jgi:hypothetical protein